VLRLALLAVLGIAAVGAPEPVVVSAAVSLTDVLQDLAPAYEAAGGGRVTFNFAASNVLARQIVAGAPVDVFLSADARQMALVQETGLVEPGYPIPLVGNELALIVPAGDTSSSLDLLRSPRLQRLAIGNPEAVPAGVYAKHFLERAGLWRDLEAKLLPAGNVRGVLAAVENAAADAGIVYNTDARTSRRVRIAATISGPNAPDIVYPAAVIAGSRRKPAAVRFIAFLASEEAQGIFVRHGFRRAGAQR
jgi:molybdate transport system substrate-binding protein